MHQALETHPHCILFPLRGKKRQQTSTASLGCFYLEYLRNFVFGSGPLLDAVLCAGLPPSTKAQESAESSRAKLAEQEAASAEAKRARAEAEGELARSKTQARAREQPA